MHEKTRLTLSVLVVACLATSLAFAQGKDAKKPESDEEQILRLEKDFCRIDMEKDQAAFAKTVHDDWTMVLSDGSTATKASVLADLKNGSGLDFASCIDEDFKVRTFGDAAVVTLRRNYRVKNKDGSLVQRQIRITDMFVRKDGRWQAVATQATRIPDAPEKAKAEPLKKK